MTQVTNPTASDEATEGRPPFFGEVSDVVMVDRMQARLFASLGRTRKLFENVASWPSLEEALAERSRAILEQHGEDRWSSAGGIHGADGEPTCRLSSRLAADVIHSLARDPGGLLWQDTQGRAWAVRLVPAADRRDPGALFGFAIGGHPLEEPGGAPGLPASDGGRRALQRLARGLRLAVRAEQLLWALHCAVVAQRRSVVLLPDVMLGQIIWGGNRGCWPGEWRHDLFQTLTSLSELRSEVLRLSSEGWQPRLGAHSVAVAHVEKLWVTRPIEDVCRPCCPMWGVAQKHCHFVVQPGYGFLGVMEKFACDEEGPLRLYDFKRDPANEAARRELKEARKAGELVTVSATTAVLGRARWSGLSEPQVRIIQALVGEITRVLPPRKPNRPDGAEVLRGNRVPGRTVKEIVSCPLLAFEGRYVAFCGNGSRRGMGYSLVGEDGGGWLGKCGRTVTAGDVPGLLRAVRQLLADLVKVRDALGLTVIGLLPKQMRWLTLEDMVSLARSRRLFPELLALQMRVYGPENFHQRCRTYLAEQGSFSIIPGARQPGHGLPLELATRIRLAGIRQVELAAHLGVSQSFVSQLLAGRKWRDSLREKAEAFVAERLGLTSSG